LKFRLRHSAIPLALLALWAGCSQDHNTAVSPPAPLEVSWLSTLPNLVLETTVFYPIQVQVSGAGPQDVDSVKAAIEDQTGQTIAQFFLYDDAGAYLHNDAPGFCDSLSGDLVANNGIFSRLVNSRFASATGDYHIQVSAWAQGQTAQTSPDTVIVAQSQPPQLSNLILPDTLASGFAPLQISLEAYDPDTPTGDSVATVEMRLFSPEGVLLGTPFMLEKLDKVLYGMTISANFAVGHPTGSYTFAFRAWDTFATVSDSLGAVTCMINLAPYLADPILPDTVIRPAPGDTAYFPITIRCWDDQTLADIVAVNIQALKPDLTWGSLVELFDDGQADVSGDTLAGDSIYTRIVSIYPSNLLGLYQFHFRSQDQAGNQSEIVDSLWVIP